jgi:nitrogen regulatory protein PII
VSPRRRLNGMKTITIITEQVSDKTLAAVLPTTGISSVTVTEDRSAGWDAPAAAEVHSLRNLKRFSPNYRIDVVLDDATVETLFDSITYAYETGYFGDAEAWVNTSGLASAA